MSPRDRYSGGQPGAGGAAAKPPASLLAVPIFRDRPRRRHNGSPPAGQAVPSTAAAEPPAAQSPAPEAERPAAGSQPASPAVSAASPESAREPHPAPVQERRFRDLKQYWRWLARSGFPEVDRLDSSLIARNWPYTLLIRVADDGLLDIVRVFAPDEASPAADTAGGHPLAGDRMSQISTWVLGLAREAGAARQPSEARERFQLDGGSKTFAADLLPCVHGDDSAAYILLNVREG